MISELKGQPFRITRLINWIGLAWKWIAGNPDATDWEEVLKSQNKLVENNNEQYKVNQALTETTQQIITEYNRIVESIEEESRTEHIQGIFNKLGILKKEIKEIVRAAQLAKGGIINTNLLNKKEILQLVMETETLPYSNEIEAIEYSQPIMLVKDSTLLYAISIPKKSKKDYNHILIRSTINNNKQIHLAYKELLMNKDQIFGIIKECKTFTDTTICAQEQLTERKADHCISQLIKGIKDTCDYRINTDMEIELLNENTVFLNNFIG